MNPDPRGFRIYRLEGLAAWLVFGLAAALGLLLALWFFATALVLLAVLVPAFYLWLWWQRFKLRHRRLPPPY